MKSWLWRLLEFSAVTCAAVFACLLVLHVMISGQGIALNFSRPMIEAAFERQFHQGGDVRLGDIRVMRSKEDGAAGGPLRLRLRDIELRDTDGARIVALPELSFHMRTGDVLRGSVWPARTDISRADIVVTRSETGEVSVGRRNGPRASVQPTPHHAVSAIERLRAIGALADRPRPALARVVRMITGSINGAGGAIGDGGELHLSDGRLVLIDKALQREVVLDGLDTRFSRNDEVLTAAVSGQITTEKKPSSQFTLHATAADAGGLSLRVQFSQVQISDLVLIFGVGHPAGIGQFSLTGDLELSVSRDGALQSLAIDAQSEGVQAADGNFELTAAYNPQTAMLEISRLGIVSERAVGTFSGALHLPGFDLADNEQPNRPVLSVTGEDITLEFDESIFVKPLVFQSASVSASWDWEADELIFRDIRGQTDEGTVSGDLTMRLSPDRHVSMGILADARIDGVLSHEEVLHYWPVSVAGGPRAWVQKNILSGNASNIAFRMDLGRGAVRPQTPLLDEVMTLTFDISDTTAVYIPSMSPLRQVRGRGIVRGSSFLLTAESGLVGDIEFHTGLVNFPWFFPDPIGEFGATLTGDAKDMLAVINEPPLGLIASTGLTPEMFSGRSEFAFELARPMQPGSALSTYKFSGEGRFDEVTLTDMPVFGDLALTDGVINLQTDRISLKSDALIQNIATSIDWERKFDAQGTTRYLMTGELSALDADNLGISSRGYLRKGEVNYEVLLEQTLGHIEKSVIRADFTAAEVSVDAVGYRKEKNSPADAVFRITRGAQGAQQTARQTAGSGSAGVASAPGDWLVDMALKEGDTLEFEGTGILSPDGVMHRADLSKMYVKDRLDARLGVTRGDIGSINIDIDGRYIKIDNVAQWFSEHDNGPEDHHVPAARPATGDTQFNVSATFEAVEMRNEVTMHDVSMTANLDEAGIGQAGFGGSYDDGGRLEISIQPSEQIDGRAINIETDDFGKTWASLFRSAALEGGGADLTAIALNDGSIIGELVVSNTRLHDTPLIARLLSSASVQGLSDLLRNGGIELKKIQTDLEVSNGIIAVKQARATGPSVGLSVDGDINLSEGLYDLSGAVAPAYQVNSFLGDLPGIGELLVSRKGEGVVAFSYGVEGAIEEPVITVNALSLLTPGVFRRIFEPIRRKRRPTTDEILNEAISIAQSLKNSADIKAEDLDAHPLPPRQQRPSEGIPNQVPPGDSGATTPGDDVRH